MQTSDTTLYTPTEAAVLTRLPLKAVNNAIDKKTVRTVAGERAGRTTRLLDAQALDRSRSSGGWPIASPPELRRQLSDALAETPRDIVALEGGLLRDRSARAAPRTGDKACANCAGRAAW